jgi:DNA-directed RNA polymerase subunit H (RpoH/RPB5)
MRYTVILERESDGGYVAAVPSVVVPDHRRLRPGTLRQILHEAGITPDQLKELLC